MILKLIPNRVKVWFLKHLYADIAGMGDGGDTELAHVNLKEVAILKAHGGAGTINPRTGLVEFKGKGGGGLCILLASLHRAAPRETARGKLENAGAQPREMPRKLLQFAPPST